MSPDHWQKVSSTLDELLGLPESEQTLFLRKLRVRDPHLCAEVESLLKQQQSSDLLPTPPTSLLDALPAGDGSDTVVRGRRHVSAGPPVIAGYEVLERI